MKIIVLLLFLSQSFLVCSAPKNTTDYAVEKVDEHIQLHIKVTAELIGWKSCDPNGLSATVRVNVYINNPMNPETYLLAATQIVKIPCGTVHRMKRPEFDEYAQDEAEAELELVTTYLNENDEDGSIFSKVSDSIYEVLKDLE